MTLVGTGDTEKHIPAMPAPSVMKVCRLGWKLLFGIEEFKTNLKLKKRRTELVPEGADRELGSGQLEYLLPPHWICTTSLQQKEVHQGPFSPTSYFPAGLTLPPAIEPLGFCPRVHKVGRWGDDQGSDSYAPRLCL